MNELSIAKDYPAKEYNFLGNTSVVTQVPDIMSPVVQTVQLDPNPQAGDVYIQRKAWKDSKGTSHPDQYAITKNGLKKLADGAGITMVSSEHTTPTTCAKCVAVNQHSWKIVQCGSCSNKDVAFKVTIRVPQLTGVDLLVDDTKEIILDNETDDMTAAQKKEFLRHYPQICEAKALNGAIRTALHIKGTYTLEELRKPFIVAYLVPNLNHEDVKEAAISSMFDSSNRLFGKAPTVQQIESRVPEQAAIEAADGENFDQYVDGTYKETSVIAEEPVQEEERSRAEDYCCDRCGAQITQKVWDYSVDKMGRPLCYKCQKLERGNG